MCKWAERPIRHLHFLNIQPAIVTERAMPRRRHTSASEVLFEIASRIPWWVGVALAFISYEILHYVSLSEVARASDGRAIGQVMVHTLLTAFASVGKYLLPLIFLFGAAASVVSKLKIRAPGINRPVVPNIRDGSRSRPIPRSGEDTVKDISRLVDEDRPVGHRTPGWSIEFLNAIDWKRFEELCAEYFRLCGFDSETQTSGPDGGIDIRLYPKGHRSIVENIVQCKQRRRGVIGPKPLRELLGVMTAGDIARGTFVTSSRFNDEARRFARENRIYLVDGEQLLEKILARSDAERQRLMDVATEGDYLIPSCPSCGTKLVRRENRKDHTSFWGCRSYPACRYTLNAAGS